MHKKQGHAGVKETTRVIAEQFWFPKMNYLIREQVKTCTRCIDYNQNNGKKRTNDKKLICSRPFEAISLDPIPRERTKKGNEHLLVIVDNFSRFMKAIPIKDAKAETLMMALKEHWIKPYVPPKIIRFDSASAFAGKKWNQFCQEIGAEKYGAASKRQKSAGMAEPNWKTLKNILSKIRNDSPGVEWDCLVDEAVQIFNNRVHSAIKMKPVEAAFGNSQSDALNPLHSIIKKLTVNQNIFDTLTV